MMDEIKERVQEVLATRRVRWAAVLFLIGIAAIGWSSSLKWKRNYEWASGELSRLTDNVKTLKAQVNRNQEEWARCNEALIRRAQIAEENLRALRKRMHEERKDWIPPETAEEMQARFRAAGIEGVLR